MIKLISAVPNETKWNESDLEPYEGVGIVVMKENSIHDILLQWHNKLCGWTLPVGKVSKKEFPHVAMVRELQEETGLVLHTMELLEKVTYVTTRLGRELIIPVYMYRALRVSGIAQNLEPHKHAALDFIDPRKLIHLPLTFALRHWMGFRYPELYARPEEIIHDPSKGLSH